jgi:flagellar biosynthetic protein FliP
MRRSPRPSARSAWRGFRRPELPAGPARDRLARFQRWSSIFSLVVFTVVLAGAHHAAAQTVDPPVDGSFGGIDVPVPDVTLPKITVPEVSVPQISTPQVGQPAAININVGSPDGGPSNSVVIILALTVLAVAPSLLIMLTSFTRMVIVLSLTRNAIGLQSIPPNQVVVGLALFLSLFVMSPTLSKMNEQALQPMLHGEITQGEAFDAASKPLKEFMLANTRSSELEMMISASGQDRPETPEDVSMATLVPAFILSELKTAFIIGFVVFIPFLIIDLVVSSVLMALGMMMLPPIFVSLPFKLLLFVMVDGWSLVAASLLRSFH